MTIGTNFLCRRITCEITCIKITLAKTFTWFPLSEGLVLATEKLPEEEEKLPKESYSILQL